MIDFHDYPDSLRLFQQMLPGATREDMYQVAETAARVGNSPLAFRHMGWEKNWFANKRPFYMVWPSIIPMLLKLDVSKVPTQYARLPDDLPELLIRLPVGNGLNDGKDIYCVAVGNADLGPNGPGLFVGAFDGSTDRDSALPVLDMWVLRTGRGNSLVEELDSLPVEREQIAADMRDKVFSLCVSLAMLGNDSGVLERVLLASDDRRRDSLSEADLQRLADKSRRRGRFGWHIGRGIEQVPHIRRPHPALYWTGKGRKEPKIIFREGSVVHRNKIVNVPTGHDA